MASKLIVATVIASSKCLVKLSWQYKRLDVREMQAFDTTVHLKKQPSDN